MQLYPMQLKEVPFELLVPRRQHFHASTLEWRFSEMGWKMVGDEALFVPFKWFVQNEEFDQLAGEKLPRWIWLGFQRKKTGSRWGNWLAEVKLAPNGRNATQIRGVLAWTHYPQPNLNATVLISFVPLGKPDTISRCITKEPQWQGKAYQFIQNLMSSGPKVLGFSLNVAINKVFIKIFSSLQEFTKDW